MKLNKRIASGALALALVTPVVANAAEGTYVTEFLPKTVSEKVVVDGQTLTKAQFQKVLEEANKNYNDYLAAKAEADNLEKSLKIAKERYEKAYEAYKTEKSYFEKDGKKYEVVNEKQSNFDLALKDVNDNKGENWKYTLTEENFKLDENNKNNVLITNKEGKGNVEEELDARDGLQNGEFDQLVDRAKEAYKELVEARKNAKEPTESQKYREYTTASYEKDRLQQEYDAAKAKADKANEESKDSITRLQGFAQAFNVVVKATNNGIAVEEKGKEEKEIDYAKLEASVARAKETLRAVEILKDLTPNTAANNQATLDALVVEQKAKVAKAEAILEKAGKKVALISTAYASEEEVTAEEVDELIKELDDNTEAIQKELKEIDKDVKVEEDKPAEDDKEEDKSEDKEDDKSEDKKDDKEEDKADDKKDDDKKADKKPAQKPVQKSTNKTAGSNAKTGIAGVAGVAGVLAAASVAYAASKKNN